MMADYVDRQAAIDRFENLSYVDWNQGVSTTWADAFSECADMIRELPSADVVEVVRCKDCKHYDLAPNGFNGMCNRQYATFYAVDFCSYGEQKE